MVNSISMKDKLKFLERSLERYYLVLEVFFEAQVFQDFQRCREVLQIFSLHDPWIF